MRSFIVELKEYSTLAVKRREHFGLRGIPLRDKLRTASKRFQFESLEEWAFRKWMYGSDLVINVFIVDRVIHIKLSRVN